MDLRKYQKDVIDNVLLHLQTDKRCCVSLATGGGKTVIFSNLVNSLSGKTLICVHREELVNQTSETLKKEHDLLIPKTKHISKDICVAMVQTLDNRWKKNLINIDDFDNLIIDECHRGEFMKILDRFGGNVIGFTATPNYEKNRYFWQCSKCGEVKEAAGKCHNTVLKKFRENIPLAEYYHKLIHGVEIKELIDLGYLVEDENFQLEVDTSQLVFDAARNEYTDESISLVFGSEKAIKNTTNVYKELCLGRKTIIFNPNTLVNKYLYNEMIKQGLNVKMYDSQNADENRAALVDWFKNTPDAVLLNVQIFTTGFDCTDVEVIFLNKKTQSLNLFLQMVGRGGRITDKIFKSKFRVVDMGNNITDLKGRWSDKRDWNGMFYNKEKVMVGKPKPAAVRTCTGCDSVIAANSLICPICLSEKTFSGGVLGTPHRHNNFLIPEPKKIIEYCERNNLECLVARKIVYNYIADVFDNIPFSVFNKHRASGELYKRLKLRFHNYYFFIQRSKLEGNKIRTLESFINEIIKQIERRYFTKSDI